jgi:hypothetical protein
MTQNSLELLGPFFTQPHIGSSGTIFAHSANWAIGDADAPNRTLGHWGRRLLNRELGQRERSLPNSTLGHRERELPNRTVGQTDRSLPERECA